MRIYDIIAKKRDKNELNAEEIKYIVEEYTNGKIADYQMSAFLMAVYINGMTANECEALTESMIYSGEVIDLSSIKGIKVDKHSTGGVGDKTTLIVTPIVASCGVKVAKMSGRGLGHTGGTIDKLESIPGMSVTLSRDEFSDIVNKVGCCIASQTGNLVPADKKMYALRDVTATVESMPLIASSIMSKKIASGSDCIVLDVKTGSGAFMKNKDDAIELSKIMVSIGKKFNRKVVAIISNMDTPLGNSIGNLLEVKEAYDVLMGGGPQDLKDICICLASNMLYLAEKGSIEECRIMAENSINSGTAFNKFQEMVHSQGGDISFLENEEEFTKKFKIKYEVTATQEGYITSMNTEQLGKVAMLLGAGREKKEDEIDYTAGIVLNKKLGDKVAEGDILAVFYSSDLSKCLNSEKIFNKSIILGKSKPKDVNLIQAKVTEAGIENYF